MAILALLAGCGGPSMYPVSLPARPALDVPDHFMVGTMDPGGPLTDPLPGTGCRNPMVDPRDGTRITLEQSVRGPFGEIGDYAVPPGRYGVGPREFLRLDCATGRALGAVPGRD